MIDINISLEDYNASSNPLCGVYMIKNKINGHMYIGQSVNIKHRFKEHKSQYEWNAYPNKRLYKAIQKYGIDNFEFTVIEKCLPEELDSKEIYWIEFYNTFLDKQHYNEDKGGHNRKNFTTTEETREKLRKAMAKRDQTKEKNPYAKAVYCFELDYTTSTITEMVEKLGFSKSVGITGISAAISEKSKSKSYLGYHFCAVENKDKYSKQEWLKKLTNNKQHKAVQCIETGKIYPTIQAAADDNNINCSSNIGAVCKGKRKTCGGYHWRYFTKEDN